MIAVILNEAGFEYDIHSLVKAFYPGTEVKVFMEGTKEILSDAGFPLIKIVRSSERIELLLYKCPKEGWQEKNRPLAEQLDRLKPVYAKEILLRDQAHTEQPNLPRQACSPGVAFLPEPEIRSEAEIWKRHVKNRLKQLIYQVLSAYTDSTLPWGALTGIRPTKIAVGLLEEGRTEEEVFRYMKNTYYASEEKITLSLEIARRERKLLSCIHTRDGYSLYIGIPFCPTTCLYCSFTSYPICKWKDRVGEYLAALEREIENTAELFADRILDSVYIGGGTPTTLSAGELEQLLSKVRASFSFEHVKEFTVEAGRADSITEDRLEVLKQYGVTRISVNPQTMNDETLRFIGRQHTVEQVIDTFHMARRLGFDNINMDIILGLPGETAAHVRNTAEAVKALSPDSLTVHSLAVKRASRLSQWVQENGLRTMRNSDEFMKIAAQTAAEMRMKPYYLYRQKNMSGNFENVGYAREGCFGIYNVLIMEEKQTIVACGAGSVSKRVYPDGRIERCENVKDVASFIERIDEMIERKRKLLGD
jgi:oxygen-independent coproporphyrinogen-3 oxidase